ncbi:MAG: Efflux ABC transporter, ATP-binding protein [Candidatus Fermentimicrarchaeum limneticum]|uniref:Efflux ABC transporter, ATP-binding protein n=1 Tax=Fermentimicrarchaeum limneticum TaxID=2795018 RepID=A0A7D5XLK6_FERL1|nr:MAG: Efflux ABC transporter, ATP-binding protein [Candidatus Fermentimicrarchaeum limneticum]
MDFAISVHNVSKKYGTLLALDKVNLKVEEGKLFALLGPNGAGKTTLLRILTTQFEPTSGEAFVLGRNVVTQGEELRELISYVPQEMSVWTDISGYENLLIYSKIYGLSAEERKNAIRDSLQLMDLTEAANRLVSTFSGGMIRKLELACAVMIKPKILFLDEPTIGLDPATRKTIWEKLKALNRESGTNVFFSTHYMDEAELYADEIGIINRGKLIKVASPDELKRSVSSDLVTVESSSEVSRSAASHLRKLRDVSCVESKGNTLEISTRSSEESLGAIVKSLLSDKVVIKRIATHKPSIDDAFLRYAGTKGSAQDTGRLSELKRIRERIRRG